MSDVPRRTVASDDDEIRRLLEAETATLEAVLEVLEREHEALLDGDAQAIETAAAEKDRILRGHAGQQSQRFDWMTRRSLAPTTPLAALVAGASDGAELERIVARLGELARACDAGNRRNGALIQRMQARARNALGVLRGSGDKGDVYSGSGGQEQGSDRRSLGKA